MNMLKVKCVKQSGFKLGERENTKNIYLSKKYLFPFILFYVPLVLRFHFKQLSICTTNQTSK